MPEKLSATKSKSIWSRFAVVFAGLLLCIMALVIVARPVSPTMRAIRSVHGEVTDIETSTPLFVKMLANLQALFGKTTVKDLNLGPRDRSWIPGQQVYNEELTDDAILQMDLSELGDLRFVDMSGPHVTDRGFSHFASSPNVCHFACRDAQVTDQGLVALEQNTRLMTINLTGNNITDAGMASLVKNPRLSSIHLGDTRITDQAIEKLAAGFTRLAHLDVASTALTTSGLSKLQKIRSLSGIGLDVTQLTDETLPLLQPITLTHLSVWTCSDRRKKQLLDQGAMSSPPIDDALIARIAQLKGIQHLCLMSRTSGESAKITKACAKHLDSMPQLTFLWIENLSVDAAVMREIRFRMPALQVRVNGK